MVSVAPEGADAPLELDGDKLDAFFGSLIAKVSELGPDVEANVPRVFEKISELHPQFQENAAKLRNYFQTATPPAAGSPEAELLAQVLKTVGTTFKQRVDEAVDALKAAA